MRADGKHPPQPWRWAGLALLFVVFDDIFVIFDSAHRFGLAGFAGFFAAFAILYMDLFEPFQPFAGPAEAAFFIAVRVIDPGHLQRRRKKILVDEGVVIG